MVRKIIKIDEEKCTGCGLCAGACHEGAIVIVDGKARLLRDDYCDGLGNCLPACPENAIRFEEREAKPFDEEAVKNKAHVKKTAVKQEAASRVLRQWPMQIKLIPINAPYFDKADLLIAADCCAYVYSNFHHDFIEGRIVLIGCPKLDSVDYSDKLSQIIAQNNIKSLTVVKMEVPCCGGIEYAAASALKISKKTLDMRIITLSIKGNVLNLL
jgi:ferredoxin